MEKFLEYIQDTREKKKKILSLFAAEGIAVCWAVLTQVLQAGISWRDKSAPWEEQLFRGVGREWMGQLKGTADEHSSSSSRGAAALHPPEQEKAPVPASLLHFCPSLLLTSPTLEVEMKTETISHLILLLWLIL